jgi:molybdopterin-dependent oxidoreductase alpha subunit
MPKVPRRSTELFHDWKPFGLGHRKPHHFREMLRIAWENRDNLRYAWRVLTRGVCDGCALGTTGLKDWTITGTHLCLVRLNLLRLNTQGPFDPALLADIEALRSKHPTSRDLRRLGRLSVPMRRRRGEGGFSRVSWDEAWADIGDRWRGSQPERTAMYLTSRGVTNETYYVAGKVMRFLGSPHIDNAARLCHSPSTAGLKSTVGVAATTCSYRDWYDADLIVFFGSNAANDQPVAIKYLAEARLGGTRTVCVNAYREPGMQRYWVPSSVGSALFGTDLVDDVHLIRVGSDLAFINATLKVLIERGWCATEFIESATTGFEELRADLAEQSMEELLAHCGQTLAEVQHFAERLHDSPRAVLVWSMGITQHTGGADTVRAIANLALTQEYVGRDGCGLMPIRGHSGVQGGAEMGAYANVLPGGVAADEAGAARFAQLWGFEVPSRAGMTTVEVLQAAEEGQLEAFYSVGGNFLETLPEPERVERALGNIPLRVHTDLILNTQALVEPADVMYLLPSRTRYEQEGGGTETSTERRVIFSPEIPRQVGEARTEWRMFLDLARAVRPQEYDAVHFADSAAIREDIERCVPFYAGIAALKEQGDQFQWGGRHLCRDRNFPTGDGKAHFIPARPLPAATTQERPFLLCTRRGKQFNSMVQSSHDSLTDADRDHLFMAGVDAQRLGFEANTPVVVESDHGRLDCRIFIDEVAPGTVQTHWPEANVLISLGPRDKDGGVPDYNACVSIRAR